MIDWFVEAEQDPFTLSTHYLSDYRKKYIAHYKLTRNSSEHGDMEPALEMMANVSAYCHAAYKRYVDAPKELLVNRLRDIVEKEIHSALMTGLRLSVAEGVFQQLRRHSTICETIADVRAWRSARRLPPLPLTGFYCCMTNPAQRLIYFLNTTIMSPSATPAVEDDEPARKKRRPGACDLCKKRKSDSSQMPNNRCTHCVQTGSECTHHEVTKNLDTGRGRKYVEGLEQRLVNMEKLFERLLPGVNLAEEIEKANEAENAPEVPADLGNLPRNDDDSPEARMVSRFQKLHLQPDAHRFYGKSSGVMLLKATIEVMDQYAATKPGFRPRDRGMRRPEYWNQCPWQIRASDYQEQRMFQFPEDDLMNHLVDLYFKYINPFLPLLHRHTFEGLIRQGEHFKDREFGGVLLLVCANASRYSDDPRVLLPGANSQHSAGWKYYQQVTVVRSNLLKKPTLYELQMYALSVCYGQGSSRPQGCWTEVGFGLRMAMDVGAHRRRTGKPTPQYELWKRAFWVLHVLDTSLSSFFGHPCTLHTDEFDLDTLVECDDEYWDTGDPETNMQQPKGKPSYVAFFNCYARLMEIYSYAMRMLYYTRKPSMYNNKATPTQVILKLDSACNAWLDSIPTHLRWDPNRQDQLFFDQSACLYSVFYHLQIFIHKPFITSLQDPASMTFPSLAICTSAARSCARIIETQSRRSPVPMTLVQSAIFISGLTLLLNIWITKQSGLTINPKDMQDVWKCMQTLSAAEGRWHIAGKLWDILRELASAGDLDINAHILAPDQQTKKRPRDNTGASSSSSTAVEAVANASPASSASTPPETPSAYMRSLQQYAMHATPNGNGAELNPPDVPHFSDEQVETFHFMNGYMNGQYAMPTDFGTTGSAREFGAQDFTASGSGSGQDFVQNDPMMEFGMFGMGDGMPGMGLGSPGFNAGGTSVGAGSGLGGSPHGMASGSSPGIAATGLGAGASRLNGLGNNGAMSNGLSASSSTVGSSPSSLHAAEGGSPHTPAVQGNFWNPAPSPFETDAWQRYLSNVDDPGYPQAPSVVNSLHSGPNQQAQLPSRMNPLSQSGLGQPQMPPPSQALLVRPMVDLQCRSRATHNKFRQLKGLLALTKLKSADFQRDVETASQEVKAHINKAWKTADSCAHLLARLKLSAHPALGEDHFLAFFGPLDELADISSLTSALQTLQVSMHSHLVYPPGLIGLVYAGIVPLVQGRKSLAAFHKAEALLQGVPLVTQIDEYVEENRRTAHRWREVWEAVTGHFRPRLILQIRRLPDDVRAEVIAPVFAARKMSWHYKLELERTAILIADV
ncbi:fungal-specific transcription factor domain-containing protein [Schizophyllum commune]